MNIVPYEFLKRIGLVTLIRVFGAIVGFISNVIINRVLGIEVAGHYYLIITIVTFLGVLFNFGVPSLIMRNTAYGVNIKFNCKDESFYWILSRYIASIVAIFLLVNFLSYLLLESEKYNFILEHKYGVISAISLTVLQAYVASYCHGKGLIKTFSFVTTCSIPLGIVTYTALFNPYGLSTFIYIYNSAIFLSIIVSSLFVIYHDNNTSNVEKTTRVDFKKSGQRDFWFTNCLGAINSSATIFIVSYCLTVEDVAVISVANRLVILVTFMMSSLQVIVAPRLARLYADNNIEKLVDYYRKTTLLLAAVSLPFVIALIIFSEEALSVFGEEYKKASYVLIILVLAQFISVCCGSVWTLLNMTGNEKIVRKVVTITTLLSLLFTPILSLKLGVEGAAISLLVSVALSNIIPFHYANKMFKIIKL
ncbi:lipopolysaccharide biosynthesis protein [Vibrio breoganii]